MFYQSGLGTFGDTDPRPIRSPGNPTLRRQRRFARERGFLRGLSQGAPGEKANSSPRRASVRAVDTGTASSISSTRSSAGQHSPGWSHIAFSDTPVLGQLLSCWSRGSKQRRADAHQAADFRSCRGRCWAMIRAPSRSRLCRAEGGRRVRPARARERPRRLHADRPLGENSFQTELLMRRFKLRLSPLVPANFCVAAAVFRRSPAASWAIDDPIMMPPVQVNGSQTKFPALSRFYLKKKNG